MWAGAALFRAMKRLLSIFIFALFVTAVHGQTFTFACMDSTALTGINCDVCPVTNIRSRSFCGLLIYRDSVPYRWIDQPYTIRVKPGNTVEYLEQIPSIPGIQTQDRITIALSQSGFSTIGGMLDSTYCHCSGATIDTSALFYASDSINHSPIFRGDTLTIVGSGVAQVTFDSLLQKYIVHVDSVSGGGGSGTVTSFSSGDLSPLFTTGVATPTTTPALSFILNTQSANTVFAGPVSGGAAAPTFRALVADDIPAGIASLWTDAGAFTYLTSTTDRAVVGSATELNTAFQFQVNGNIYGDQLRTNTSYITHSGGERTFQKVGTNMFFAEAGNATASGSDNYGFGNITMPVLSTGSRNMAIGKSVMNLLTSGDENTGIGSFALEKITTGESNVGIGPNAVRYNTGSYNVGIGRNALLGVSGVSNSNYNVGIGYNALLTLTSGQYNIAIGYLPLNNINTGSQNTAMGRETLTALTSGNNNTVLGHRSAQQITTGTETTMVGSEVGYFAAGTGNVYVGRQAGYGATGASTGTYNVGIGWRAGYALRGGSQNTFIGFAAGDATTSGSSNISIGASTDLSGATVSNELRIASAIYGTTINTFGSARVGIGVVAPARTFHVAGEVRIADLTTDTPTLLVGADGDGDLNSVVVGTGLTLSGGTLTTTGGAPIVAANNGLSLSGSTVQWGGSLIQNTTIDQDTWYQLHKDGKKGFYRYNTGNPFTDVNVTGTVDITGKGLAPSINTAPSEDNILTLRGHNGTSTYYANAMFFGTYVTEAYGSWIQTRSESAYTTHYPLNLNPNGGKIGIGRDPQSNTLDAHVTISRALSGSTITGIHLHTENTEGEKSAHSFGSGNDVIDAEIGYFDGGDIFRATNRNTASTSSVRIAVGGETADEVVVIAAGTGFGTNVTTNIKSTIQDEGSLGLKTTTASGDLTLNENHCIVLKNGGSAAVTWTLPDPDACVGRFYWLMNHTSQTITLSRNVTTATGGVTFNTLGPGEWAMISAWNGNGWRGHKQVSL